MIDDELWNKWLAVRLEVRVNSENFLVFDPVTGYGDLDTLFLLLSSVELTSTHFLYLITAWNPNGVERSRHQNNTAQARLLNYLLSSGVNVWPSKGSSDTWHEFGTSFLAKDDELALAVSKRFDQAAYYRVSDREVYCVDRFQQRRDSLMRVLKSQVENSQ